LNAPSKKRKKGGAVVAIRHHADIALSEHYFGRSGDLFEATVPYMRRRTAAGAVLKMLGIGLAHQDGAWRLPLPCPQCKAEELTASGAYPCRYRTGVNDLRTRDAGQPDRFVCDSCNGVTYPDKLLPDLPAKQLDELVKSGPLRPFAPERKIFIVAELDEKRSTATTVPGALRPLLGPTFALTQKLCRIQAMDLAHAQELVAKHHAAMPWKEIEIGRDLEPAVDWHGGPLADWEKRKLENRQAVARVKARKDLDDELETIRRARLSELT
jgi:hypothetical protein